MLSDRLPSIIFEAIVRGDRIVAARALRSLRLLNPAMATRTRRKIGPYIQKKAAPTENTSKL